MMIDLFHTLQNSDLAFLKMVADAWGLELKAPDAQSALHSLGKSMLVPELVDEILASLSQDAIKALQDLLKNDGMLPWSAFSSRHGEVRVMGPAKRDRERPDLYPSTPAEVLWYRGMIGKAFLDIAPEPQEYALIPEDLIPLLITLYPEEERLWGRPASPRECAVSILANDRLLDDLCTLLAALRLEMPVDSIPESFLGIPVNFLIGLLKTTGMVEEDLSTQPESVRLFLEDERGGALARLVEGWVGSSKINELRMLPHLRFEGTWHNHPLETRQVILELVSTLPENTWWSLSAFIGTVKDQSPDFQRTAGDYDSWFIVENESGDYLRGRATWEKVDGALLRFMLCGPMHWLGLLDLARPSDHTDPSAFRLSKWAKQLWHGSPPPGLPTEDDPVLVNMDGRIRMTHLANRASRYQIARFGEWEAQKQGQYIYRITPQSLQRAQRQGLRVQHLLSLLKKHTSGGIPPMFLEALNRWEKSGSQASLQSTTLLEVDNPEIIAQLLKTPAKRFLGKVLNPTTIEVNRGGESAVQNALFQIGYLTDSDSSFSTNTSPPLS